MILTTGIQAGEKQSSDVAMMTCPKTLPRLATTGERSQFALSDITGPETRSCHFPGVILHSCASVMSSPMRYRCS